MALPDKNRSLVRMNTVPVDPGLELHTYTYATKSTGAQVLTAGYFNFGRGYLKPGDRITAHTEVDAPADSETIWLKVATVPASGNVTVTDITPAGGA
jgi:hypothetical protein